MVSFKSFVFASAAILATFVTVEAEISPSYPEPGTIQTEGTAYDITWDYDGKDSDVTYQIDFMTGSNDNQTVLANVAKKVKGSALKYSYTAPAVDPNSAIYFFMFTGSDGSNYWTTRFGIVTPGGSLSAEPEQTQPDGEAIPWGNGKLADDTTTTDAAVATAAVSNTAAPSSVAVVESSSAAPASSSSVVDIDISQAAASTEAAVTTENAAATSAAQLVSDNSVSAGSVLKPVLTLVSAGVAAYFAI